MFLIFVYGTLKTGEPNYHLMKDETCGVCKPLGIVYTKEKYPLVVASRYNVPYLLYQQDTGHNVEGELYEVDEAQLERLDKLENHPNYYVRKDVILTKSKGDQNSEEIHAQSYFLVSFRPYLMNLQMLETYSDNTDGKEYVKPSYRDVNGPCYYHEVHTGYEKHP